MIHCLFLFSHEIKCGILYTLYLFVLFMIHFLKHSIFPISFLVSSIIGAGMFALPFAFQQAGLGLAALYLFCFGLIATLVHLIYADVVLRTRETRHQFPGYVRQYLGDTAGTFSNILVYLALLFTLTAYLILSVSFLSIIAPTISPFMALFLFWALSTVVIFTNIRNTALFDTITTSITLLAIGAIFIYWGSSVPFNAAAFPPFNATAALLPFGPVLFSLLSFSAIPPLVAYIRKESIPVAYLKKVIAIGSLTPAFFYFLFVVSVWGISMSVSPDSVSGLINSAPASLLLVLSILGLVSLWDSYATVGRDMSKLLEYEWRLSPGTTLALVAAAPPVLYMLGFQNFITVVGAVGGILFGTLGILIVLTWKKAAKVRIPSVKFSEIYVPDHIYSLIHGIPTIIIDLLLIIFAGGIIYAASQLNSLL